MVHAVSQGGDVPRQTGVRLVHLAVHAGVKICDALPVVMQECVGRPHVVWQPVFVQRSTDVVDAQFEEAARGHHRFRPHLAQMLRSQVGFEVVQNPTAG